MTAIAAPMRRPGVRVVYEWELRKLAAQKRTYIGLGCALLVPLIFIIALLADDDGPEGIPFADYVRESGLAIPLVGLYFAAFWFFPLITALVAGDIVATEDSNGTLKTILTRSVDRWQIFVAKVLAALTYAFAALLLYVGIGLFFGGIIWGFDPLVSLSGNLIEVDRALLLLGGTALVYFLPTIADRLAGDPALHRHPQLGRRGRRHADDLADHAVARDHHGAGLHPPLPAPRRSSTRGKACCATRSTGRRSSGPRGCRRCTPFRALRWRSPIFCAAMFQAAESGVAVTMMLSR